MILSVFVKVKAHYAIGDHIVLILTEEIVCYVGK